MQIKSNTQEVICLVDQAEAERMALDLSESRQRRALIVEWLRGNYEYYIDLTEQWAWQDGDKAARCFEAARRWRLLAEQVANVEATTDQVVNLIWLGEIQLFES